MFEFKYDDFVGPLADKGLRIVVRNTQGGKFVAYALGIDPDDVTTLYSANEVYANELRLVVCSMISNVFLKYIEKNFKRTYGIDNWMYQYKELDQKYLDGKRYEIEKKIEEYSDNFLKEYFHVDDMRDLIAIDDFFDKPLFS